MKVDLARSARCLKPLFDFAMARLLLNAYGQEVRGYMLFDFNTKCFPNPQACSTTQNEHHPLPFLLPGCHARHDLRREAGSVLLRLCWAGQAELATNFDWYSFVERHELFYSHARGSLGVHVP